MSKVFALEERELRIQLCQTKPLANLPQTSQSTIAFPSGGISDVLSA